MRALAALTTILLLLSLLPGDTVRAAEPDYGSGEFHVRLETSIGGINISWEENR